MNKIIKMTSVAIVTAMVAFPVASSAYAQSAGGNGGPSGGGGGYKSDTKLPSMKAALPPTVLKKHRTEQSCDYQWRRVGILSNLWAFRNCRNQEFQR